MLKTYKKKLTRAMDDKVFVDSISEYISELGICSEHICRYCKDRTCKDEKGFLDIDECQCDIKERLGNWFVLPRSAWNPQCHGLDCEFLMICLTSAIRELFHDPHGQFWYPELVEKIKQYDLWEQPAYDSVNSMHAHKISEPRGNVRGQRERQKNISKVYRQ